MIDYIVQDWPRCVRAASNRSLAPPAVARGRRQLVERDRPIEHVDHTA